MSPSDKPSDDPSLSPSAQPSDKPSLSPSSIQPSSSPSLSCDAEIAQRIVQRESLIAIYDATNGDGWTINTGWFDKSSDECAWYGVSCTGGIVTSLSLGGGNNLVGTISAKIASLTELSKFDRYSLLSFCVHASCNLRIMTPLQKKFTFSMNQISQAKSQKSLVN